MSHTASRSRSLGLPRSQHVDTLVLASAATGLADFIERLGGSAAAIFRDSGLPLDMADRPNNFIHLSQYCRAMRLAAEVTGKSNFGLWFGQQYTARNLGMWGYLGASSPTLGSALRNMEDYFQFHQHNSRFALSVQGTQAMLEYQVLEAMEDGRHDTELSLGMFLNVLREALGPDWSPTQVWFSHERPKACWGEHQYAFGADVRFGQTCNALIFHARELETPMPFKDALLAGVMKQSLQQAGANGMHNTLSIGDRASQEVRMLLRNGYPSLEEVAQRLRLPSWTLQRRLSDEKLSFKEVVETVRIEQSLMHLSQPQLPISEVAHLLGYTDVSSFSRAFGRWHGMSPRQWRDKGDTPGGAPARGLPH